MTARPIVARAVAAAAAILALAPSSAGAAPAFMPSTLVGSTPPTSSFSFGVVNTAAAPDGTAFVSWVADGTGAASIATRPPGGAWSTQVIGTVQPGSTGGVPIATAADGSATALLTSNDGSLRVLDRAPGGAFGAALALTVTGRKIDAPSLAVSRDGGAVATWLESTNNGTTWQPRTRIRAGGAWNGPTYDFAPAFNASGSSQALLLNRTAAAINDAGRAAVGVTSYDGTYGRARVALRPVGADFAGSTPLDAASQSSGWIDLAVADNGAVGATYATDPTSTGIQATGWFRSAGAAASSFSAAQNMTPSRFLAIASPASIAGSGDSFWVVLSRTAGGSGAGQVVWAKAAEIAGSYVVVPSSPLSGPTEQATVTDLAVNARGDRFATWVNSGDKTIRGAIAPAGSPEFETAQTAGSTGGGSASSLWPDAALDAAGNAVVGWINNPLSAATKAPVAVAGFDAVAPTITSAVLPATGGAAFPIPFSATATDVWGTPRLSWAFGDGGTADGASVSHTYEAPNPYTATVTATDDVGNSSSQSSKITVSIGDRDGDGVLSDKDCDDSSASIRPGIRDVPGDGIDQNCDGADAKFGVLATTVRLDWVLGAHGMRITSLGVRGVRVGDKVKVECKGTGCPAKKSQRIRTTTVKKTPKGAKIAIGGFTGRTLRPKATLRVTVSRLDYKLRITTWTVRAGKRPIESVRCQIPGAKKTETCK